MTCNTWLSFQEQSCHTQDIKLAEKILLGGMGNFPTRVLASPYRRLYIHSNSVVDIRYLLAG